MADKRKAVPYIQVSGVRVNAVQIPDIIRHMDDYIADRDGGNYIVVTNVDTVVKSKSDKALKEAVNASSLSIPDGFPLLLLGRMHGYPLKKRAYGPDLMFEFLKMSEHKGYSHFFYGATHDTLTRLVKRIKTLFPGTKIAGFYAPPFRLLSEEEDAKINETIKSAAPDILWVGIGCPKQELWMYGHGKKINIPVMVGVGAAFDFLAGTKPQAPRWVMDIGFEWLFRLMSEPGRLWRRYLIGNSLFIYYMSEDLIARAFARLTIRRIGDEK